jgi:choline dehydrogenase-like flavoprotein
LEVDDNAHGTVGPLVTAPHDPAPISKLVLDSFRSKRLPLDADMFTTGSTAQGCGHAIRSIYQGVRTTSVDYLGQGQGDRYPDITTLTERYVDTVGFETDPAGKFRASKVRVLDKDGNKSTFTARKEIIITAGAYGSPAILLRSGIGPKDELAPLGIDTVVDVPGVGKNLMDHMVSHLQTDYYAIVHC